MTRGACRNVLIREATIDDREGILVMVRHFLERSAYGTILHFDSDALMALVDAVVAKQMGVVYVADTGDEVVGMLAMYATFHPAATDVKIADELVWWVEPEYRTTKVGPYLLRCGERWARQIGVHLFKMVAPAESPKVAAYYEAAGYQALETAYFKRLN